MPKSGGGQQQLSEEMMSTGAGVAYFGGASSSGNGGGVQGMISPQAHLALGSGFQYPRPDEELDELDEVIDDS